MIAVRQTAATTITARKPALGSWKIVVKSSLLCDGASVFIVSGKLTGVTVGVGSTDEVVAFSSA